MTFPKELCFASAEGPPPSLILALLPQSKTLEELSEIYASAADAQEVAAASSDPLLARERLQSVLRDIAGAASFPAIVGEEPPPAPLSSGFFCQLSPSGGEELPCAAAGAGSQPFEVQDPLLQSCDLAQQPLQQGKKTKKTTNPGPVS